MSRLVALEAFDLPPDPKETDPEPGEDWRAGHATGLADGLAMAAMRQDVLSDGAAQAINDLVFTYAEARAQVLAALQPLIGTIMDRLLPELGRATLLPLLVERIMAVAAEHSAMPVVIRVPPSTAPALITLMQTFPEPKPGILADASLEEGQALIAAAEQENMVDLEGLVTEIRQTLEAFTDETQQEMRHG